MLKILYGIHAGSHHSSITRFNLETEEIKVFSEERFSKSKAKGGFPVKALRAMFKEFPNDQIKDGNLFLTSIFESIKSYIQSLKEDDIKYVNSVLPDLESIKKENYILHHEAHLYAAIPFRTRRKSTIIVFDGSGGDFEIYEKYGKFKASKLTQPEKALKYSFESYSVYEINDDKITCREKVFSPSLLNKTNFEICTPTVKYNNIAAAIFGSFNHSGKVMGLATSIPREELIDDNQFISAFSELIDSKIEIKDRDYKDYINLAQKTQSNFENWLSSKLIETLTHNETEEVIICGGGALNCTFNGYLEKILPSTPVQFIPFPNDEGVSLGACLFGAKENFNYKGMSKISPFLGSSLDWDTNSWNFYESYKLEKITVYQIVDLLISGGIIITASGRSECGPRALGNRSIIANPFTKDIVYYLNSKVKQRELFRPYGLIMIQEELKRIFLTNLEKSDYMNISLNLKDQFKEFFKEVTHGDGTIRIQTLNNDFKQSNLEKVLREFKLKTGFGCLINTSLNLAGEPLVENINDLIFSLKRIPHVGLITDKGFFKVK